MYAAYTEPNVFLANHDKSLQNDPITPFVGAKYIADLLGDSATLIEQDGFGHTSLAEMSTCSRNIVNKYLVNGTVSFS